MRFIITFVISFVVLEITAAAIAGIWYAVDQSLAFGTIWLCHQLLPIVGGAFVAAVAAPH